MTTDERGAAENRRKEERNTRKRGRIKGREMRRCVGEICEEMEEIQ